MEKDVKEALLSEVKSQVEKTVSEGTESLKSKISAIEAKESVDVKEFNALKSEHVTAMAELKAMKEKSTPAKSTKGVSELLTEKSEELKSLMNKKGESINISVKSVGTLTTANVVPTAVGGIAVTINDPESGITPIPRSQPFIQQLFPASGTIGNTISYAEMANPEGGAGTTGEGGAKSQADFEIVESSVKVKKVTAFIKTSKEALADIAALAGEINNELLTLVELKADSQVLSGDGLSNNLKGVLEYAETFDAGDFAGTIVAPNEYDVLNVASVQIQTAEAVTGEPAGFIPNVIVLNPIDAKKMALTKDKNDNYVFALLGLDGTRVAEVPVITNARMTKGTFLVMDSTKGNLRVRENTNVQIGYENDDFTKNLVTILAEKRLAFYVKSQYTKAFVTGDFATAKEDLAVVA
jgi:HK97 family phage major capsid protein